MKKILFSTLFSIIFLVIISFICSTFLSIIQYNNSTKVNPYLVQFISIVIFLLSGMVFGLINKKQGLLGSITFILVYFIMLIIFKGFSNINIISIILKFISFTSGSILLVNLRH